MTIVEDDFGGRRARGRIAEGDDVRRRELMVVGGMTGGDHDRRSIGARR